MLEIVIPTFNYEGNDYVIKEIKNINSLDSVIKFCDGSVNNVFADVDVCEDYKTVLYDVFKKYKWLNRIIIKSQDDLIKVFKRQFIILATKND